MSKETEHLDSRRNPAETGGKHLWCDYLIKLDDSEAVEKSPFRSALEGLKELGMDEVLIWHPTKGGRYPEGKFLEDNTRKWFVSGMKIIADSEKMAADDLGGSLTLTADIGPEGERTLDVRFGGGSQAGLDTIDLNEMIWAYLEVIHKSVSKNWEGRKLPIKSSVIFSNLGQPE